MLERITFSGSFKKDENDVIRFHGHFVEMFFLRCLENFNIKKLGKISINLFENMEEPLIWGSFPKQSVAVVDKQFHLGKFMKGKPPQRRLILLNEIIETFEILAKKFNLDLTEIYKAYNLVKSTNFDYNFIMDPVKLSRDRKYKAGVEVWLANEEAKISIVFIAPDKDRLLKRIPLETIRSPWIFNYSGILGKRKWISNLEYELKTRSELWKFVANVQTGKYEKIILGGDLSDVLRAAYSYVQPKLWNPPKLKK